MSIRYASVQHCARCKRDTPHTKAGACALCRSRVRKATRKAKASAQGSNFARTGDVRSIADDLWSVWVRAYRLACEMCHAPLFPDRLQCAHGHTRETKVIRFDPDNTFALCSADHRRHTPPQQPWWDWMRSHLGDARYMRLEQLARIGGKLRLSDYHAVVIDATQRIAALPAGERKEWAIERARVIGERMVRLGVRAA